MGRDDRRIRLGRIPAGLLPAPGLRGPKAAASAPHEAATPGRSRRPPPGLPPILLGRCRSPPPPAPSRPSCSRSSFPGAAQPRHRRRRPSPVAQHARPGLPSRQGAATGPGATPRPGRRPRRGRRAPRQRRLPRGDDRGGHRCPLANPDVEVVQAEEGKPLVFKATVQVPPGGPARRLQALQLPPRDRDHRRRPRRQGPRGAARPERDPDRGRGPRGAGRRLRGDLVRRVAQRRAVRGRQLRADAADPRPGAADPGLRGQPARARGRRLDRVRHHLPRRLPRDRARRPAGTLRGRAARAAREGPARARRRLHRHARGLRRPRRAARRHQGPARAQRHRPGPPRVRRQDHRLRRRQRDPRAARTSSSTRRSR